MQSLSQFVIHSLCLQGVTNVEKARQIDKKIDRQKASLQYNTITIPKEYEI